MIGLANRSSHKKKVISLQCKLVLMLQSFYTPKAIVMKTFQEWICHSIISEESGNRRVTQ